MLPLISVDACGEKYSKVERRTEENGSFAGQSSSVLAPLPPSLSLSPHRVAPSDKLLSFGPARPLARTTFLSSFSIGSERLTPHRNKTVSAGDLQDVGDRHETRLAADSWSHGPGRQGKGETRPIIPRALPCSLPWRTARRLRPHKLPRDTTPLKLLSAEVLRQRERGDQRKLEGS